MNENKIYLLWYEEEKNEPKLKTFNNFDDAVREYVKVEGEKEIIEVNPHSMIYSMNDFDRVVSVSTISEKTIWKRAYELEKGKENVVVISGSYFKKETNSPKAIWHIYMVRDTNVGYIDSLWSTPTAAIRRLKQIKGASEDHFFVVEKWAVNAFEEREVLKKESEV